MLNVHIGAPGIAADLLQSLANSESAKAAEDIHFVPPSEYHALLHELVHPKVISGPPSSDAVRGIREFINFASALDIVAISKSNFLGYPHDILRPRKSLPMAGARVGRLSGLLSSCEMTFHLVITRQVDFILQMRRLSTEDRLAAIGTASFSWSELVSRIRLGAPERNVVVWDFGGPASMVRLFAEMMLGIETIAIKQQVLQSVSPDIQAVRSGLIDPRDDALMGAIARLDEAYQRDLGELDRMEGVTLMSHLVIPPELFH
jgi:hypothetical protein